MRRIHGPRVKRRTKPPSPTTLTGMFKSMIRYIHQVSQTYFSYRGNLLARGIAYSIIFTLIPALFLALYIGSILFNHSYNIQEVVYNQISQILPITQAPQVMGMVQDYMSGGQWHGMGITGIIMLFFTPHFLFAAIERALSLVMNPPEERKFIVRHLLYFLTQLLVMLLLFGFAFVSVWIREAGSFLEIPHALGLISSKTSTIVIMGLTLSAIYRISYHHTINNKVLFSMSFLLSLLWQLFSSSGSAIIAVTGKNQVMYGVMTGAIILLVLAYLFSVMLIVGGIIIGKESKIAGED